MYLCYKDLFYLKLYVCIVLWLWMQVPVDVRGVVFSRIQLPRVIGSYELLNMGAGNRILVLWKNSKHC